MKPRKKSGTPVPKHYKEENYPPEKHKSIKVKESLYRKIKILQAELCIRYDGINVSMDSVLRTAINNLFVLMEHKTGRRRR